MNSQVHNTGAACAARPVGPDVSKLFALEGTIWGAVRMASIASDLVEPLGFRHEKVGEEAISNILFTVYDLRSKIDQVFDEYTSAMRFKERGDE